MSRGEIVRLLSYFEAFSEGGYRANSTPQSRARLAKVRKSEFGYRKINGVQYFISRGKGSMSGNREQHLKEGVYSKTGTHGAVIKPVLIFTEKAPTYTPTLPFYETAEEVYGKRFESEYTKALEYAIATSR